MRRVARSVVPLLLLSLAVGACRTSAPAPATASTPTAAPPRTVADSARIRADVDYLAGEALLGRRTGTPGNDSAAAFIARRFAELGLEALPLGEGCDAAPTSCPRGYLQRFVARSAVGHATGASGVATSNVAARLPGSDPTLRQEHVVIGAHLDHLGESTFGALDPDVRRGVRYGADDNASGTATVLELARLLRERPPKRSLVFVLFSGEEQGLLGSRYFVDHPPVPIDSVVAMLNFDMVGRLRGDKLIVYGSATAAELPAILDSVNVAPRLVVRGGGDGYGRSDHTSFYVKGIPVLHFFTDLHEDYHRVTDTPDRVTAAGTARVTDYAMRVARAIADRPSRLTPSRPPAPPAVTSGSSSGYGPYFGSIPDMSAGDVVGVRLMGVRDGSPAQAAGLKEGDVLVEFGGKPIKDLNEYTAVLRQHKPGDTVTVVVRRGTERLTLRATLGTRGD